MPSPTNSIVFWTLFKKGGGSNQCLKILLQIRNGLLALKDSWKKTAELVRGGIPKQCKQSMQCNCVSGVSRGSSVSSLWSVNSASGVNRGSGGSSVSSVCSLGWGATSISDWFFSGMASLSFFGSSHEMLSTLYWVSLLVTRKLEATTAIAF